MDHYTTIEAAKLLGMAVRSVQLMVDRGELEAWKTPGGHRRISRNSIDQWLASRHGPAKATAAGGGVRAIGRSDAEQRNAPRILLIEDSTHFQNLVTLVVKEYFPQAQLHVADDGIAGLAMYGQMQPDVLIVDIQLPGIDGATLITSLRSHPEFRRSRLIVVTALDEERRQPYAFALDGVPVVHKPLMVVELPALLAAALKGQTTDTAAPTPAHA